MHCDLKAADAGVGGGPSRVAARWDGEDARRIAQVLEKPENYPHCQHYRMWPGPNSNTFVAWVLREAGIAARLDPRGIGRSYRTAKQ